MGRSRLSRLLRHMTQKKKKRQTLASGGLTVAITGADGAGKSTIINNLVQWLSWRLTVRSFYLGSSQPSLATALIKSVARVMRKLSAGCKRLISDHNLLSRFIESFRILAKNLSYVGVGRDLYNRFNSGQKGLEMIASQSMSVTR